MAIGVAVAGIAVSAVQVGVGINQSRKARDQAQKVRDEQARVGLRNPYANIKPSTIGADIRLNEANRNFSQSANVISSAGSRGLSYLTGATNEVTKVSRNVAADIDRQALDIDLAKAGDDVRIRGMEEARTISELTGYAQLNAYGQAGVNAGISGGSSAIAFGASAYKSGKPNAIYKPTAFEYYGERNPSAYNPSTYTPPTNE